MEKIPHIFYGIGKPKFSYRFTLIKLTNFTANTCFRGSILLSRQYNDIHLKNQQKRCGLWRKIGPLKHLGQLPITSLWDSISFGSSGEI
jgi:hypothetical protein